LCEKVSTAKRKAVNRMIEETLDSIAIHPPSL
jgi:hypothetical protein